MIRRLYLWTMNLAASPRAQWALFLVAFAESSFFPIPPDILLIPMVMALPVKGFRYAALCTLGSVLGGAFGYLIGHEFMDWIGEPIIAFYGAGERFQELARWFIQYDVWIVAIAGFSPVPYKLITIAAGTFKSDFPTFMAISIISRGGRFFLVAGLLRWGGDSLRQMVEKHLELLTASILVLVIVFILLVKFIL